MVGAFQTNQALVGVPSRLVLSKDGVSHDKMVICTRDEAVSDAYSHRPCTRNENGIIYARTAHARDGARNHDGRGPVALPRLHR